MCLLATDRVENGTPFGQESFCAGTSMTDDDYIEKITADPDFKDSVQAATAAMTASGREAPQVTKCLSSTQVIKRERSSIRLIWKMAFVTSSAFNDMFKILPESVAGLDIIHHRCFNGMPVTGVLFLITKDIPDELHWIEAEVSTETDFVYMNYVHDKTDVH